MNICLKYDEFKEYGSSGLRWQNLQNLREFLDKQDNEHCHELKGWTNVWVITPKYLTWLVTKYGTVFETLHQTQ